MRVLIALKDAKFRIELARMFSQREFVVEDIDSLAAVSYETEYSLVATDEQLRETEGSQFVLRLREFQKQPPMVLVTETWLDAFSLEWLRDIVKTSVIVQKSTVGSPHFFEAIELVLDSDRWQSDAECADAQNKDVSDKQKGIEEVQAKLRAKIADEWQLLAQRLSLLEQSGLIDEDSRQKVIMHAHQLRGSGGSVGLKKLGECAAKIEQHLKAFYDRTGDERKLLWDEIRRLIETGANSLDRIQFSSIEVDEPSRNQSVAIVLTDDENRETLLKRALKERGFFIMRLVDPGETLKDVLHEYQVKLIVVDSVVAGLLGFDVCRLIAAQKGGNSVRVLLVSKFADTGSGAEKIEPGFIAVPTELDLTKSIGSLPRADTPFD